MPKTKRENVKLEKKTLDKLEDIVSVKPLEEQEEERFIFNEDLIKMSYTTFKLFYAFLKASKIGSPWNGGRMTKGLKITQRGNEYTIEFKDETYKINPETFCDISKVILNYIE